MRLLGGRRARDDEPVTDSEHRGHDLARLRDCRRPDEDARPLRRRRMGAGEGGGGRSVSAAMSEASGYEAGAGSPGATASRAGWRWPPTRAASRWAARRPLASPAQRWGAPSRTRARECAPSRASRTPRTAARRARSRARRRRSPGAPRRFLEGREDPLAVGHRVRAGELELLVRLRDGATERAEVTEAVNDAPHGPSKLPWQ